MANVKKMLGVTIVFLCLGLLAAIIETQPLQAANVVPQPAQAPDAGQATGVPVLLSPEDNAVTTGVTNPPVGVPSLVWSTVADATKYNVQISLSAGFASTVIDVTTAGLSFTPLTALADGVYFWRVSAFNKEWGAFSTPRTFTKDWSNGGALTPQLISPTDGAERTAFAPTDFSWQPMIGAATYLFEICPDRNFTAVTYSATTITPNHTPPQRLATNTYFWRVTPIDAQGHAGRPSNINRFIFRWNIAPALIAPEDGLQTSFVPTFTWTAVEGAKTYRVQVDTESDFPSPTLYTTYNTAFVWEQNLANDAEYFWRVQVVDDAGNTSDWSSTRSFRMRWNFKPQLLAPPNNSLTQSYPVFSWTPIPGIERYQIQVDESLSFATPLFDSKVYNNHTATITQFKESIIYLKTAYYWRVRGIDAQDNLTPWSDISTFEFDYTTSPNPVYPLPYALPDSITLPVHDDHTVAWPLFIWDTAHAWPQGHSPALARAADYYILTLSTDPSFITSTFQITTTGLAATPTIQNPLTKEFADHQLYYWRVRAMRDGQPMGSDTVRLTRI
ncbi:MAG: hypothetical protein NT075_30900, partial [Chloroflexi bacterium]|nr:hypothetical protein [Chloroflexota bacterium]